MHIKICLYLCIYFIMLFMLIILSSIEYCLLCVPFPSRARTTCGVGTGCRYARGSVGLQQWRWPYPCPTPPPTSILPLHSTQYLFVWRRIFHCCRSKGNPNTGSTPNYLIRRNIVPFFECIGRPLQSLLTHLWCCWYRREGQRALPFPAPPPAALDRTYHPISGGLYCWLGSGTYLDEESPCPQGSRIPSDDFLTIAWSFPLPYFSGFIFTHIYSFLGAGFIFTHIYSFLGGEQLWWLKQPLL